jgi:hypothetical protein
MSWIRVGLTNVSIEVSYVMAREGKKEGKFKTMKGEILGTYEQNGRGG